MGGQPIPARRVLRVSGGERQAAELDGRGVALPFGIQIQREARGLGRENGEAQAKPQPCGGRPPRIFHSAREPGPAIRVEKYFEHCGKLSVASRFIAFLLHPEIVVGHRIGIADAAVGHDDGLGAGGHHRGFADEPVGHDRHAEQAVRMAGLLEVFGTARLQIAARPDGGRNLRAIELHDPLPGRAARDSPDFLRGRHSRQTSSGHASRQLCRDCQTVSSWRRRGLSALRKK